MSDTTHWAYPSYQALLEAGMVINETRFGDPLTRGEAFVLLNNMLQIVDQKINAPAIQYKEAKDYCYIKASPEMLKIKTYDKTGIATKAVTDTYAVNGTFYTTGKDDAGADLWVPTSPIVVDGAARWRWASNHTPKPQSAFIIWKDNTVSMKRIKSISELDLSKVKHVVAGLGLVNTQDSTFKYDFNAEWSSDFSDITRNTYKTCIGYSIKENKVYLIGTQPMYTSNLLTRDLLSVCKELNLDYVVNLDNGGSTFLRAQGEYKNNLTGDNRKIHHTVVFE